MTLKTLFRYELTKNMNKHMLIVVFISIYVIFSNMLSNPIIFKSNLTDESIMNFHTFGYYYSLIVFFVFFSILNIVGVSRDIKHNVMIRHFAEGLKRSEYMLGKFFWLIFSAFFFILIYFIIGVIVASFNSISLYQFFTLEYFKDFSFLYIGLIAYGLWGILYTLILKSSLISILVLISHYLLETTLSMLEFSLLNTQYSMFLPLSFIHSIINNPSPSVFGLYSIYCIVLVILIKLRLHKMY